MTQARLNTYDVHKKEWVNNTKDNQDLLVPTFVLHFNLRRLMWIDGGHLEGKQKCATSVTTKSSKDKEVFCLFSLYFFGGGGCSVFVSGFS